MRDSMCFACSPQNPVGLHLKFDLEDEICRAVFTGNENHQGWDGLVHGGLLMTLLDEAMAQWLWRKNIRAMTAEINVRFSLPVAVGQEIAVEAHCEKNHRRLYQLTARIILPDGRPAARATAKFLTVD